MHLHHFISVGWSQMSPTSAEIVCVVIEQNSLSQSSSHNYFLEWFAYRKEPIRRKFLLSRSLGGRVGDIGWDVRDLSPAWPANLAFEALMEETGYGKSLKNYFSEKLRLGAQAKLFGIQMTYCGTVM